MVGPDPRGGVCGSWFAPTWLVYRFCLAERATVGRWWWLQSRICMVASDRSGDGKVLTASWPLAGWWLVAMPDG
jgi:hypothetical protein